MRKFAFNESVSLTEKGCPEQNFSWLIKIFLMVFNYLLLSVLPEKDYVKANVKAIEGQDSF